MQNNTKVLFVPKPRSFFEKSKDLHDNMLLVLLVALLLVFGTAIYSTLTSLKIDLLVSFGVFSEVLVFLTIAAYLIKVCEEISERD